ncbi:hypothetical protein [Nesterenkonia sp. F]|uniref:hypothetical protein n=1 Tax=Nesterenkonia sp. F TaxID=795955 RepID=UPI000255CFAE|nr:hypothetical protein [Nesterenkonia sp. F]
MGSIDRAADGGDQHGSTGSGEDGASRPQDAVRSFGRRSSGMTFAVMITVLLVALVFAANQNDVIGWIIVVISGAWLVLAGILVFSVRRGAQKVGQTLDSARADAAARRTAEGGGTAVIDEDAHQRNMKLDHSFKIVQVQRRVVAQEIVKGAEADLEMAERALDTIETTAHNGRDILADVLGGSGSGSSGASSTDAGASAEEDRGASRDERRGRRRGDDGPETISGDVVE